MPISKTRCLQSGRKRILPSWRAKQYFLLKLNIFYVSAEKKRRLFLKNLYKSWESLVTLQLQSDCFVVFWANESEKQDTTTFCTILPNKEEVPYMELSRDNDRKRKESPYMEMWPDNDKKSVYKYRNAAPKSFFNFDSRK